MPPKIIPLSLVMGFDIVKVFVGKKRKEFDVHKKLICQASKFFDDAFNGPFKEGQEGQMYMPEEDPEVFSCFVDWLYRNPLPIIEDNVDFSKKLVVVTNNTEHKEFGPLTQTDHLAEVARTKKDVEERKKAQDARLGEQVGRLLKLYFFGEKMFINELMNRAMDRLQSGLARYDRYLCNREVKQIYLNTCQGSMLRSFSAELIVYNLGHASDKKLAHLVSLMGDTPELTKDILVECKSLANFKAEMCCDWSDGGAHSDPRFRGADETDSCEFHKHDPALDVQCYRSESEDFHGPCPACGYGRHGWDCCCH